MSSYTPIIEPEVGDELRLIWFIPAGKNAARGYPTFERINPDYSHTSMAMRPGIELAITCACHPGERRAMYSHYWRMPGYQTVPVLQLDGAAIELDLYRSTHSCVIAKVVSRP